MNWTLVVVIFQWTLIGFALVLAATIFYGVRYTYIAHHIQKKSVRDVYHAWSQQASETNILWEWVIDSFERAWSDRRKRTKPIPIEQFEKEYLAFLTRECPDMFYRQPATNIVIDICVSLREGSKGSVDPLLMSPWGLATNMRNRLPRKPLKEI